MALVDIGREALMSRLIGQTAFTLFDATNAHVGVGNGTTAVAATDVDLSGASKARKAMDAGYPTRSGRAVTFRSTFGTADANFAWEEVGIHNAATGTAAPAAMLNRFLSAQGTKTNTATWQLTVTVTLA
ncbi:MAG: hypothetical protein M3Q71_02785 [Chloroflexota bacterium]|nr:hypothetical protein [Chloroflexota bacterium]